ncbi:glycosyltransferase [Botrimarina mediterranea]|uniref:glycosyltransferase n=1 Tax=Botrimarina mediterranea TaxID=2528022 RepID=UPI001E305F7D|nr:glycosyltransferase [Botrimarina mediterranea]
MRVLFISNLYPHPYQWRRAPWNRQQIAALSEQCPVRVIAPLSWIDEWRWAREQGELFTQGRRRSEGCLTIDHPTYWYPPRFLRSSYGECFRRSISCAFRAAVKEFQPEIVLAAWAYPDGWAAEKLCHETDLPCVIKVHGSDVLQMNAFSGRAGKTAAGLRAADGVVAVSDHLRREVVKLGVDEAKVNVVYDGVDTSIFSPGSKQEARESLGIPPEQAAILFVGNLVPVKGIDRLLSAAADLVQSTERLHVHLVGAGPEKARLQELAIDLGVSEKVTFHGPREHAELPNWFRAANVVCLPSHSEGVPNVLLESAACGAPFVAFDVGGIREIAHLGPSTLAPADKPEALAGALRPYLEENRVVGEQTPFRSFRDSASDLAKVLEGVLHARAGGCRA